MITCSPKGICSWEFEVAGEGHTAGTQVNWVGEQGTLMVDGILHTVSKDGIFSGRWNFESGSEVVFSAQKQTPFSRTFEIAGAESTIVLSAESALKRAMQFKGAGYDCRIAPVHAFTRRSLIEGRWSDFRLVSFAFWLTVLLWRRQASKS